jgi:hypothetical protein
MTGGPLRRLQEFAAVLYDGLALFASDEGGESRGPPAAACQGAIHGCDEIESKNLRFDRDTVILAWQTMGPESCSTGTA